VSLLTFPSSCRRARSSTALPILWRGTAAYMRVKKHVCSAVLVIGGKDNRV
jgi:hypothetical protein